MCLFSTKIGFIVTGGTGFLGSFVTAPLEQCEYRNVSVPRRGDYDLAREDGR